MRQTDFTIAERLQRVFDRNKIEFCAFCASPFIPDSRGNCGACGAHPVIPMAEVSGAAVSESLEGLDISQWTVLADQAKARVGKSFCIIRARDGIKDDTKFQTNRAFAETFPVAGSYAFFNPRWDTNEAKSGAIQAQDYYNLIRWTGLTMPPVLDLENATSMTMPARATYLNELRQAVDRLYELTGRYPILYSNISFFNSYLQAQNEPWIKACPLWIANPSTTAVKPSLPTAWTAAALWQYRLDVTSHPGLSVCDYNRWPGTVDQLKAWCKDATAPVPAWGAVQPPEPPLPPVPVEVTRVEFDALSARVAAVEARPVQHTHDVGPAK